jgi:hypothetical protein
VCKWAWRQENKRSDRPLSCRRRLWRIVGQESPIVGDLDRHTVGREYRWKRIRSSCVSCQNSLYDTQAGLPIISIPCYKGVWHMVLDRWIAFHKANHQRVMTIPRHPLSAIHLVHLTSSELAATIYCASIYSIFDSR